MDDIDDNNLSQQSGYMDLTASPDNIIANNSYNPILDRPPRNFGKINDLRSIQELPQKYRCLFDFPLFNIIQSNVIDDVLYSDVSVVISAPTGSGKTIVFELAIIRLLMKFEEVNFTGDFKIIYVAPVKSLCHERLSDWHTKFSKIGLSVIVSTGDSNLTDLKCLKNYHIIITTPEKWDSLTRNAKASDFLDSIKLFMIDEVHLLNEEQRGPNLEVVVSRMKILRKKKDVRFMAVSATIPNIEDIAEWLGNNNEPAVYFKIGEELRPVKLNKVVIGYPCASETANFKFDVTLNYKLQNVLMQYAEGKPTLIFCSTRKGVELTASHLSSTLTFHLSPEQSSILSTSSQTMFSTLHKSLVSHGIGVHHAGMSLENRLTIEGLFRDCQLPVLVATSTLAMGVNLPAHLVVVKGTKQYVGGNFQEYGEGALLQMIGRAGRPRFDSKATVVIMTTAKEKQRYEKMLGGTELIESNLHRHLVEHLNAEVVLGTITDIAIALEWLRYTFLYIRVLKNPKHYNIPMNYTKNQIEKKLQDWCQIEINVLNKYGMLQIDQNDGFSVVPTNLGNLMANYYLAFNTMKIFTEIKGSESLSEMLMLISKCTEFSETYLRVNDKKTLNTLNKCKYQETIRFSLASLIKTTAMKIYCIIQAVFGCIKIQNPTLHQESIKIMRTGERISKCLVTYLLHKNKFFSALLSALILNQCFMAKLWENSPYVARQFPKIGPVLSSMLVSAGKTNFKTILECTPRDIERIINRAPPMGNEIIEAVLHLPFYKIHLEPSEINKYQVKITVTLLNSEDINKSCTAGLNSHMTLLIGDTENNILVCKKLFHHSMATCKEYIQRIDVVLRTDHVIQVYLISENWVGIDCKENYDIIINQGNVTTNATNNFVSNAKSQTEITSYFNVTKNAVTAKKPTAKKKNSKTIDSYFKPNNVQNKNTGAQNNDSNSSIQCIEDNTISEVLNTRENVQTNNNSTRKNIPEISSNNFAHSSNQYTDNNSISEELNTQRPNVYVQKQIFNFGNSSTRKNIPEIGSNSFVHSSNQYTDNNSISDELNTQKPNVNVQKQTFNFDNSSKLKLMAAPKNKTSNNSKGFALSSLQHAKNNYNISEDLNVQQNTENIEFNDSFKNIQIFEEQKNNAGSQTKGLLLNRRCMSQQDSFEVFSQKLAQKFSQPSNYIQNIANSVDSNTNLVNRLETNRQLKTALNQFKFVPHKLSHKENVPQNFVGSQISLKNLTNDDIEVPRMSQQNTHKLYHKKNAPLKKKPVDLSQNFVGSQISLNNFTNDIEAPRMSQQNTILTNEELDKFKQYMNNKNTSFDSNRNISCTITSQNQLPVANYANDTFPKISFNETLKNINDETRQNDSNRSITSRNYTNDTFRDISFNETSKNINDETILLSSDDSTISLDKNVSPTKDTNLKIEKPPKFHDSFREYVQNSIDNLKKKTLVNEYYNLDIGFQEFLMGPLDESSSSLSCNEDEQTGTENNIEVPENITNSGLVTPKNSLDDILLSPNSPIIEDVANITFSSIGEVENKLDLNNTLESFNHSFCYSPENSFNSSFIPKENNTMFSTDLNFSSTVYASNNFVQAQVFENSEELSENATVKVENRLKFIEQYYDSPICTANRDDNNVSVIENSPLKRRKLSDPSQQVLFSMSRNKKYFKDRVRNNDSFKKMNSLQQIMSTYGNNDKKICLSRNKVEEPIKEEIKQNEYNFSVTIYEKQIYNSFEMESRKTGKEKRKHSRSLQYSPD